LENEEDSRVKCRCLPHVWPPEPGQGFLQFQGRFLEPLAKVDLLAKLRLLCEGVLVQSLATLKLLAGEKMELPLLRLGFLPGQ
jgi:hypothetical protein